LPKSPRTRAPAAFREIYRGLQPSGLLAAFHTGDEVRHVTVMWEQRVSMDFYFFQTPSIRTLLESADLEIEEVVERYPYPMLSTRHGAPISSRAIPESDYLLILSECMLRSSKAIDSKTVR
jgi:hypothetical protein